VIVSQGLFDTFCTLNHAVLFQLYLKYPSESSSWIAIHVVLAPNGEVQTHPQLSVQSVNVQAILSLIALANHDCHGVNAATHVFEKYTLQFVQE
jgi:hypothetical protein